MSEVNWVQFEYKEKPVRLNTNQIITFGRDTMTLVRVLTSGGEFKFNLPEDKAERLYVALCKVATDQGTLKLF